MKFYSEADLNAVLDFPKLISALRTGFSEQYVVPQRMHLDYDNPEDKSENTMLLMPAVRIGDVAGVKIVNVAFANSSRDLPSIQGVYYLLDAVSGVPLAFFDAKSLTNWRTAAASALAASYLALESANSLLMIGTGALAPFVIEAHAAVRSIKRLYVYGRSLEKAKALADCFKDRFDEIEMVKDLTTAIPKADIVSAATLSETPLVLGKMLRSGQHVDLIGSFKPDMREADDQVMKRSRIYVDILESAPKESGDLAIPLASGVINAQDLQGDLFQLCRGQVNGRKSDQEITLFKSVGHALEDLVAARLIWQSTQAKTPRQ